MVAGCHSICNNNHTVRPAVYSVGCVAIPHWRDLYVRVLLHGGLGRTLLPMARRRELSAELRLADLDGLCRDNPRLAPDENQELHTHFAYRWPNMGLTRMGFQLHTARAFSPAGALHESPP